MVSSSPSARWTLPLPFIFQLYHWKTVSSSHLPAPMEDGLFQSSSSGAAQITLHYIRTVYSGQSMYNCKDHYGD